MISVEEARQYYPQADSAHGFDHVLRVLALAERIARAEGADLEIVRAAVLLHDVSREEEAQTGHCHARIGAERAREILRDFPPDKVEAVVKAIAAHRFRQGPAPQSLEAQVLYDADKLDAIGAIGVARAYAMAGHEGRPLWGEPGENPSGGGPEHTPVHEFAFKLSRLKDGLFTATARQIAVERHRFMVAFFQRLADEVQGKC
ncbi:MAG: HD domain-containing protein [Anaerolineae bacterium]|nr:HD domain-containing protein [Anaerolineae bacterium]MDH7472980.1 HD domain-containing protein [Anaerolineae bacterium]